MENRYILAVDQSTSATKAILFDSQGKLIHRCTVEHNQYYPKAGWVEHDAEEIFTNTLKVIRMLLRETQTTPKQITTISITNQRETAVVWDKHTGKPIYNAIVWQCNRAGNICKQIEAQGFSSVIKEKTGLVLSPYFSAAKVKWILDNVDGAIQKAENGELLFGTIDSWLVWKLTEGKVHVTDYSNASRTQLFNIHELKWDDELLQIFSIPKSMMPKLKYSDEIFGYTSIDAQDNIPISGIMGDSHAALFGQNCFSKGMVKATYGTGSSIMMNIGENVLMPPKGIVTSIAWGFDGQISYVFEGNINCTGATIKWLVDMLELIPNSRVVEEIASSITDNGGVYLVPSFVGMGAPYWDSEARAIICGLTSNSNKAHVVRAAEESIAYQIKDILDLMIKESDVELCELRVDGGPTNDSFLMQFQSDILNTKVVKNELEELSALGSCYAAGIGIGFWKSIEEISSLRNIDKIFTSKMLEEERDKLYSQWKKAVNRALCK